MSRVLPAMALLLLATCQTPHETTDLARVTVEPLGALRSGLEIQGVGVDERGDFLVKVRSTGADGVLIFKVLDSDGVVLATDSIAFDPGDIRHVGFGAETAPPERIAKVVIK